MADPNPTDTIEFRQISLAVGGARRFLLAEGESLLLVKYSSYEGWRAAPCSLEDAGSDVSACVVLKGNDEPTSLQLELLQSPRCVPLERTDGRLLQYGNPLPVPPPQAAQECLSVIGMNQIELRLPRPATFKVRCGFPSVLRLRGPAGDLHSFKLTPPEDDVSNAWYDATVVFVDDSPRLEVDGWSISPLDAEPEPPRRLHIVFDRTCPDTEGWPVAYQTSRAMMGDAQFEAGDEAEAMYGKGKVAGGAPAGSPATPESANANRRIRQGTASAIDKLRGEYDAGCSINWFADISDLSADATGSATSVDGLDWLPGVDLFDALEEAMDHVVTREVEVGDAIIIIGNSPPRPGQSAALRALTEQGSRAHRTTAPRWTDDTWERSLRQARRLHCAVLYVWVQPTNVDERYQKAFNSCVRVWTACQNALRQHVFLVNADATMEGVRDAVTQVGLNLTRGSAVEVRRDRGT